MILMTLMMKTTKDNTSVIDNRNEQHVSSSKPEHSLDQVDHLDRLPAHVTDALLLQNQLVTLATTVVPALVEEHLLGSLVADITRTVLTQVLLHLLAQGGDLRQLGDARDLFLRLLALVVLQEQRTHLLGICSFSSFADAQIIQQLRLLHSPTILVDVRQIVKVGSSLVVVELVEVVSGKGGLRLLQDLRPFRSGVLHIHPSPDLHQVGNAVSLQPGALCLVECLVY